MYRVYLETTIFNRYLEDGRDFAEASQRLFEMIAAGRLEGHTSLAVIQELDRAPSPKREQMLALIEQFGIMVWEVPEEAYNLADEYVNVGIIPARFRMDGLHIATATVTNMDFIVSLNFHHINKAATKLKTEVVNKMKGYGNPTIHTPQEVIE